MFIPSGRVKVFRLKWLASCSGFILLVGGALSCAGPEPAAEQEGQSKGTDRILPAFTDITAEAGLGEFWYENGATGEKWFPESMGSGGGFIDYDGDGWIDILLVGGGTWSEREDELVPALWLYRNNGDGTFSLRTDEAGLGGIFAYGLGISVADYDNDGDEDFYFTTLRDNMLFRNDGGRFTDVGQASGAIGEPAWSTNAIFFDADQDGWLDLYVGNYVDWSIEDDLWCTLDGVTKSYCTPELYSGIPSRFYRNNGDGTFIDQTEAAGFLPAPGKTLGAVELDFNKDGWPDLVVACDTQRNLLYENNGDGTFTEKGAISGIAYDENGGARAGMGIDVGIVDHTGEETVFVGNFSREMIGVFRHVGNGLFIDRAAVSKIGRPSLLTLTFGLFLFDPDLDGDLDLFTANGHVQVEIDYTEDGITYKEPPHLFINRGDGIFEDVAKAAGGVLSRPIVGRGAAYADIDRDGDQDILITTNNGPAYLWRNDQQNGHFLRVQLEGRQSNRNAIGIRIVAVVGDRRMERRIRTGSSFLSQMEKTVTFGLGASTIIDSLIIYWRNGRVARFADVGADQEVRIVEGADTLERQPLPGLVALAAP